MMYKRENKIYVDDVFTSFSMWSENKANEKANEKYNWRIFEGIGDVALQIT